jgi:hypothetical protein
MIEKNYDEIFVLIIGYERGMPGGNLFILLQRLLRRNSYSQ